MVLSWANVARGIDDSPVVTEYERKSYSQERTFNRDLSDLHSLKVQLWKMSQGVAEDLKRGGLAGGTVAIKLRYSDFTTLTRQMTQAVPTDDAIEIYRAALILLERAWEPGRPVRLLGVGTHQLQPADRPVVPVRQPPNKLKHPVLSAAAGNWPGAREAAARSDQAECCQLEPEVGCSVCLLPRPRRGHKSCAAGLKVLRLPSFQDHRQVELEQRHNIDRRCAVDDGAQAELPLDIRAPALDPAGRGQGAGVFPAEAMAAMFRIEGKGVIMAVHSAAGKRGFPCCLGSARGALR